MSKRILVTGGAGFIGSHICHHLVEGGDFVYCLDNLFTGHKSNIKKLEGKKNFQFIEQNVMYPLDLDVSEIYHFACPASPPQYQKDPIDTAKVNFIGTLNVLNLARKNKAKTFFSSTSEVYGDPDVHPQPESYRGNVNPIGPRACYDEGKRIAETLCFDFMRMYGIDVKVARFFNTYGPNMDPNDGRVVSNFIVQALLGNPITVYGNGQQTRSFCYIDDLVSAIFLFMNTPQNINGPINLGNPNEFTVMELAERVLKLTNAVSEMRYLTLPVDDPRQRKPDLALAKQLLDWQPTTQLQAGLIKTIDYFKYTLNNEIHV